MKMRYKKETTVAVLTIVALVLLYFGFNFLKGKNILNPVNIYHGRYNNLNGLTEQAPVYIKGYKVGQVDKIHYDFSKDSAFIIDISVNKDIHLPKGTTMSLVADGLLGGMAIQLDITNNLVNSNTNIDTPINYYHQNGDNLPTQVVPGLIDALQANVINSLSETIDEAKNLLGELNKQLADNHLYNALANIDTISADLTDVSVNIKHLMTNQVPGIITDVDSTMQNLEIFSSELRSINLVATVEKADSLLNNVNQTMASINSTDGTLGLLLNDTTLYTNINSTISSADSLLIDLKANPKRYVHFSLFGKKAK